MQKLNKNKLMGGNQAQELADLKAKLLTILADYKAVSKTKAAEFGITASPLPEPNGQVQEVLVVIDKFAEVAVIDVTNEGKGSSYTNLVSFKNGDKFDTTLTFPAPNGLILESGKSYFVIVYEKNREKGSNRKAKQFIFNGENPNALKITVRTAKGQADFEIEQATQDQLLTTFGEQKLKLQTLSNEWRDAAKKAVDAEFEYIKGELIKALKAMKAEVEPAMWKDAVLKAGNFTAAKILEFITGSVIAYTETKTTKDWVKIAIAFGKRQPQFFLLACAFDVGVGLIFDAFITAPVLEDPVKAENERLQEEWYKYVDEQVAKVYSTAQEFKNNIKEQADKFVGTLLALKEPEDLNYEQGKLMLENAKKIVEVGQSVPRNFISSPIIQQMLKEFPYGKALVLEENVKLDTLPKGDVTEFMKEPFQKIGFNPAFVYQRFEAEGRKLLALVRSNPDHLISFAGFNQWILLNWHDNATYLNFSNPNHIANASAFAKFIYDTIADKNIKAEKNLSEKIFPDNGWLLKNTNNNENLVAHFKATNNVQQQIVYKVGKNIQLAQYLANPKIANAVIEIRIGRINLTDSLIKVFTEDDYRKLKLGAITWSIEFEYQELAIVENASPLIKALIMGQKPEWFAAKKAVITGTKIWQ